MEINSKTDINYCIICVTFPNSEYVLNRHTTYSVQKQNIFFIFFLFITFSDPGIFTCQTINENITVRLVLVCPTLTLSKTKTHTA